MKKPTINKTAEKLLNSAERLFAEYSYNEVSIRQITDDAEVKLALVHYHFGSKEDLYREVIKHRIGQLSSDRIKLLQYHKKNAGDKAIPLVNIVDAFISPYLYNTLYGEEGWKSYAKIVGRLLSSGSALSLSILCDQFDPYAEFFLEEMRKAVPTATEQQIQWGFDFLVASMCSTFAEVDRIKLLSDGLCSIEKPQESCQYLCNYITSGLEGILVKTPYNFSQSFAILKSFKNS